MMNTVGGSKMNASKIFWAILSTGHGYCLKNLSITFFFCGLGFVNQLPNLKQPSRIKYPPNATSSLFLTITLTILKTAQNLATTLTSNKTEHNHAPNTATCA
ncbi:hypothetical protein Droror1_Dr00024040 [Drosera rotundifolia]